MLTIITKSKNMNNIYFYFCCQLDLQAFTAERGRVIIVALLLLLLFVLIKAIKESCCYFLLSLAVTPAKSS